MGEIFSKTAACCGLTSAHDIANIKLAIINIEKQLNANKFNNYCTPSMSFIDKSRDNDIIHQIPEYQVPRPEYPVRPIIQQTLENQKMFDHHSNLSAHNQDNQDNQDIEQILQIQQICQMFPDHIDKLKEILLNDNKTTPLADDYFNKIEDELMYNEPYEPNESDELNEPNNNFAQQYKNKIDERLLDEHSFYKKNIGQNYPNELKKYYSKNVLSKMNKQK